MKYPIAVDVECTIFDNGNPFSRSNRLVRIGVYDGEEYRLFDESNWNVLDFSNRYEIIGFNLKFDLHWLRRVGISFDNCSVWDCQLAEFLLESQKNPYPSLARSAYKYGLGEKLDIVSTEYWDKGINTDKIPPNILDEYLRQDLKLTWDLYERQKEILSAGNNEKLLKLFKLQCKDLLVLEEMEWNGLNINNEKCKDLLESCEQRVKDIATQLYMFYKININNTSPIALLNLNSPAQLAILLYGGSFTEEVRNPVAPYKTGAKKGQPRYKITKIIHEFPPLFIANADNGTDEATLKNLPTNAKTRKILDLLVEYKKVNKLISTYFKGIPELGKLKDWEPGTIHGNLNQCVAETGRLSSSAPNLQNFPDEFNEVIESGFKE